MFSLKAFSTPARRALGLMSLCLLAALLFTATACSKKTATKEGAAELKAALERSMERLVLLYPPAEDFPGIAYEGEVIVTPQGDYYDVTLPHVSVKELQGGTMDIGVLQYKVTPAGQNQWRETWAWPSTLTGYDAAGAERIKISIGEQSSTGVWNAEYDIFTDLDAYLNDVSLTYTADDNSKIHFDIGSIKSTIKLEEKSTDIYSGPTVTVLEDVYLSMDFAGLGGPFTSRITRVECSNNATRMNLKAYYDYLTTMATISQMEEDNFDDPAAAVTFIDEMLNYMTSITESYEGIMSLQGVEFTYTGENTPDTPVRWEMDKLSFGLNIGGFRGSLLNIGLNFSTEGLNQTPAQPGQDQLQPFTFVFNSTTENLPHKELSSIVRNSIADYAAADIDGQSDLPDQPTTPEITGDPVAALTNAGTAIRLDGTRMSAGGLEAQVSGAISANADAAMNAVADLTLAVKGVDKAMTVLSQPDTPPEVMQQGMMVLGMLQAMGKPEVSEDGSNTFIFNLQLSQDGQATLNGEPLPVPGLGGPDMQQDDISPTLP